LNNLFSSAGPKSYSYRTNEYVKTLSDGSTKKQRDEITHVKGFSLRGDAKKKQLLIRLLRVCEIKSKKLKLRIVS
jgi:hypothetical protein